jgi:site-specific DNA-methyltransferase (adenine-specific)
MKADEIRLIKGRLKFGDSRNSAPFPSAIIIFKPGTNGLKVSAYEV